MVRVVNVVDGVSLSCDWRLLNGLKVHSKLQP